MRDSFRFEAAARSVAFVRPGGEEGGREGGRRRRPMEESALRRADWPARRGRIFQADRSEPNLLSGEEERRTEGEREGRKMRVARPPDRPTDRHIRRANFQIAQQARTRRVGRGGTATNLLLRRVDIYLT